MSNVLQVAVLASALLLLVAPASGADQGSDELWQITSKIEMPGLPMAMPEQTQTVCLRKDQPKQEAMVPADQNCRMTDLKQSGNRTTFTMVCEGKDRMTGTGEIVSGPDRYTGSMRLQGVVDGKPMDMTQKFSGRRTGTCTYQEAARQPAAAAAAAAAPYCGQALEQMQTAMFVGEQAPCQAQKPEFCARVARLAQEMREPRVYRATVQRRSDWASMLQACGQDASAVTAAACQRSIGARDYTFTGDFCEAEARALAAQHCAGRDYTVAMSSEYAPLCRRFASDLLRPAAGAAPAQPAAPPVQSPGVGEAAKEGVADGLREGLREGTTDAIKRLFRW